MVGASSSSSPSSSSTQLHSRTALDEISKDGAFQRRDAAWRNWIQRGQPDAPFPPEPGRYHLYVAYACPWAHRTLLVRALKGLEDVISITVVHPVWQYTKPDLDQHCGWIFGDPNGPTLRNTKGLGGPFPPSFPGNEPEPFFGLKTVRDVYEKANDTDGKYSVPILWDKKTETIVSNESSEIIRMLNSELNEFSKNPDLDLYPDDLIDAIEEANAWIYPGLNNGVYRCGFAKTQEAYDVAITELTDAFDRVDETLQRQRYIAGNRLTLADLRLFVTLLRFDEVYQVYFKTNTRSVTYTPAILNYCREIYQLPGVSSTVNMEQIKYHYFCSHYDLNTLSIVPRGADFEKLLMQPHDRNIRYP
jgi:glutathionyl-hydroquinone reductase